MLFEALHLFCLLSTFTLTKQEWKGLEVRPTVVAECGEQVSLHCNTSSPHDGLSVKHMEWSRGHLSLCSVDSEEKIITHKNHSSSVFYCTYKDGQLSLFFQQMLPLESGNSNPYMCKLRSNQGVAHNYTTVKLQECSGTVVSVLNSDGPNCTFNHVHPDGEVLWFHGSQDLSNSSVKLTAKSVDNHGWLTIHSWLSGGESWRSSHGPYNCSLKSSASGRILTSTLVQDKRHKLDQSRSDGNGVEPHRTMTTALSILVSLLGNNDLYRITS